MFDSEKRPAAKAALQKPKKKEYRQISAGALSSCYVASAAIAVIAGREAVLRFGSDPVGGTFYIILAVLGVLFSVFITVTNNRNKKYIRQGKGKEKQDR